MEDALPQGEKWSQFSKTLIEIGGAVKDVIEIGKYFVFKVVQIAQLSSISHFKNAANDFFFFEMYTIMHNKLTNYFM